MWFTARGRRYNWLNPAQITTGTVQKKSQRDLCDLPILHLGHYIVSSF